MSQLRCLSLQAPGACLIQGCFTLRDQACIIINGEITITAQVLNHAMHTGCRHTVNDKTLNTTAPDCFIPFNSRFAFLQIFKCERTSIKKRTTQNECSPGLHVAFAAQCSSVTRSDNLQVLSDTFISHKPPDLGLPQEEDATAQTR